MVFIGIVIGLLVLAGVIYSAMAAKKRREELSGMAVRLGLAFSPGEDYELAERFGFLDKLAQGSNRYASNVLSGSYRQNEVLVFDYHYETHSTDSKGNRTDASPLFLVLHPAAAAQLPGTEDHPRGAALQDRPGVRLRRH